MPFEARVSKSGYNALTATDPRDFVFHSAYNTFKIIAEGSASFDVIVGSTTHAISHGQGYTPFVIAYCNFPDGHSSGIGSWQRDNTQLWFSNLRVSSSQIIFYFYNNSGSTRTVYAKYYIAEVPL